jgi:ABC-type bacteriocin/lantibiotic exporter with double-glycine peptidase domain
MQLKENIQNNLLTNMTQWIKQEIFNIILISNNENMNHVNFVEFITPITRISISCYALLFDCITVVIPTIVFLFMISIFFFYVNPLLGTSFFIANCIIFLYIALFWESLSKEKNIHEIKMNENEKFIIDILNNIDKVISRGQNHNEMNKFSKMTRDCIDSGIQFLSYATNHVMVLNTVVCIIILACSWYLISLNFSRKITSTMFITLFTILLIYRERTINAIQNIPDYLEFVGRLEYIIEYFNKMLGEKRDLFEIIQKKYVPRTLDFNSFFLRILILYIHFMKKLPEKYSTIFLWLSTFKTK